MARNVPETPKGKKAKTCHLCKKRVDFPLWWYQWVKKQEPTCEDCLVRRGLGWVPPTRRWN